MAPMPSSASAESRQDRHWTDGLFALRTERSKTKETNKRSPSRSHDEHSNDENKLVEMEEESNRNERGFDSNESRTDTIKYK